MIGLRDAPYRPSRMGGAPVGPATLGLFARSPSGLGALGISVSTAGTCPHTEYHTTCEGGQTVTKSCTAYRNCQTGALVGTDCWNDTTCGGGGGGGGGGGSCAGGYSCDGKLITGAAAAIGAHTCGTDLKKWTCGSDGHWHQDAGPVACTCPTAAPAAPSCASTPAQITANYLAWRGTAPSQAEIDAHCQDSDAALDAMWKAWCAANPGKCSGPDWLAYHTPPVSSVPSPGQQTTPGQATAPPTPIQECDAPMNVTLDHTERWVEVDPVRCLWQIVRTTTPGQPVVLPNVYGGTPSIIIPQSAPPAQVALDPSSVGLYQPTPIGGPVEVTDTTITQAFVDVLGRGPLPDELAAAEAQHFTNVADLYAYLHTLDGGDGTGGGTFSSAQTWITDHPYATAGLALVGVWFLAGRRRR